MLRVLLVSVVVSLVSSNTECLWATGELVCQKDQTRVKNTVIEIWDKDGPEKIGPIDAMDPDDMAGLTVVDNVNGIFKVEGCASDIDWLGPFHKNRPEFFLKVRHRCNSDAGEELILRPPQKIFAPITMDYYMENPIILDA